MDSVRILFELARKGRWEEFTGYLKSDDTININIPDINNNYLIDFAIILNNIEVVATLINKGAKLDITDSDGRSVLYVPIKYGYTEIINLLLHFNKTVIGVSLIDIKDKQGNTPLNYAIKYKNIDIVKLLLNNNANPDITNIKGDSSVHMAVYSKDVQIISALSGDLNIQNLAGETPLHIACNLKIFKIIEYLVKNNTELDLQDYENGFTALHYSVNLDDVNTVKMLLSHNANPNIQDVTGNTAIHYALSNNNANTVLLLLDTKNINLTLYNIDNKLPVHLVLESKFSDDIVKRIVISSMLNFQDNNGVTPLHYISKNSLWKQYKDTLITKKLDIFIKNKKGERPVDYVDKKDIEEYLEMTVDSYLYIVKNNNYIWKETWENVCRKIMFGDSLTDDELKMFKKADTENCRKMVKNKLLSVYKSLDSKQGCLSDTSYPYKKNKQCIKVSEGEPVKYCTFTGIIMDVLVGLIFLLKKHPISCSTLSTNFIKNKNLCDYYSSIGIDTNTKCEFLNFEIVWVYYKIYFSSDFVENFKKCKKQFIVIPLGIEIDKGAHANYLIYDKETNEIERFEPYGSESPYSFDYNSKLLDNILTRKFKEIDSSIVYIEPSKYLPKIGFQMHDISEHTFHIGDPGGFCALWSIWYVDMRLTYKSVDRKVLVNTLLKNMKKNNVSFKNTIRNYSVNVVKIRDEVLNSAEIDINRWINKQYDNDQLIQVIKKLTTMI